MSLCVEEQISPNYSKGPMGISMYRFSSSTLFLDRQGRITKDTLGNGFVDEENRSMYTLVLLNSSSRTTHFSTVHPARELCVGRFEDESGRNCSVMPFHEGLFFRFLLLRFSLFSLFYRICQLLLLYYYRYRASYCRF